MKNDCGNLTCRFSQTKKAISFDHVIYLICSCDSIFSAFLLLRFNLPAAATFFQVSHDYAVSYLKRQAKAQFIGMSMIDTHSTE